MRWKCIGIWALVMAMAADGATAAELDGLWAGTIHAGAIELRVVIELAEQSDGQYSGVLTSIDQGGTEIPISTATLDGQVFAFEVPVVGGRYTGTLDDESIIGHWQQGAANMPLTLTRTDSVPKLTRPQEPVAPLPYRAEEVRFDNPEADGVTLAGTLTLPEGDIAAAVVLVSGSGAQNRDEALAGHKPFLVVADHLTRQGIAVLRYDDRGFAESSGDIENATTEDFAGDAIAAVRFLEAREELSGIPIGIVGHSEGGMVAPIAANLYDGIAFVVLMAGPAVTGEEIIYLQSRLILQVSGARGEQFLDRNRKIQEEIFAILKEEPDIEAARGQLLARIEALSPIEREVLGYSEGMIEAQLAMTNTRWFRRFLVYDPVEALVKLECPAFAIFGEKDLQVPPSQNETPMRAALKAAPTDNFEVRVFPGLNHLFQTAETGSPTEYAAIGETFSPVALEAISTWILEHAGK